MKDGRADEAGGDRQFVVALVLQPRHVLYGSVGGERRHRDDASRQA
jgi:hypothetical protein